MNEVNIDKRALCCQLLQKIECMNKIHWTLPTTTKIMNAITKISFLILNFYSFN